MFKNIKYFILAHIFCQNSFSTTFRGKNVTVIHSGDTRGCFFFQLGGIGEADPARVNNPWFAFSFSKPSADAIFSLLLAAYLSNNEVTVPTTGDSICDGYAETKRLCIGEY